MPEGRIVDGELVEIADVPWRVGAHYGIHVYQGERPVATFHDALDAEIAVAARNLSTPVLISDEMIGGIAQAMRDANATDEARAAWQQHPQIMPMDLFAEAALAWLAENGYVISAGPLTAPMTTQETLPGLEASELEQPATIYPVRHLRVLPPQDHQQ